MDILMLCGEIGKKGISKDRCDGRVRLAVGGPCCLVFALVKLQKSQVRPLVSQIKTQRSPCPRADHIWEGQFVLSKLRYIHWEEPYLPGDTELSDRPALLLDLPSMLPVGQLHRKLRFLVSLESGKDR